MACLAEAKPVFVGTGEANGFRITEKDLEAAVTKRTRCLVLNSPSNPTGGIYDRSDLEMIAKSARKHGYFVVSDEIYEKLIYDGKSHHSIASIGKDIYDLTITVNGVSKSYSMTGWRIGYAAGPADVMKAIGNLQSHAASNPASISQKAALAALTQDQGFIDAMRAEYQKRRDYMVSRVNAMKNVSCFKPSGAFYLFCDISKTRKGSVAAARALLTEARVAAIPGEPFGADGYIRLSFATGMEAIKKGMDRMEEYFAKNG
jgi:aspartate aminotransferase